MPVIKNVRVLAIDQNFRRDEKNETVIAGTMATLDLDLAQANVVTVLSAKSPLILALRSLADNEAITPEVDLPELMPEFRRNAAGGIPVMRAGVPSVITSN